MSTSLQEILRKVRRKFFKNDPENLEASACVNGKSDCKSEGPFHKS